MADDAVLSGFYKNISMSDISPNSFFGMERLVLTCRKNLKVFYSIVNLVAIFMVDNLRRIKFSSKMLFHKITMNKDYFSVDHTGLIPTKINPSAFPVMGILPNTMFLETFKRTVNSFISCMGFTSINLFFTVQAWIKSAIFKCACITKNRTVCAGCGCVIQSKSIKYFSTLFAKSRKQRSALVFTAIINSFFKCHDNIIASIGGVVYGR